MYYDTTLIAILCGLYLLTILGVVGTILVENRNPLKASAWVIVIVFIPFIGLISYLIFGQDQRRLGRISKRFYRRLTRLPHRLAVRTEQSYSHRSQEEEQLITLIERSADSPMLQIASSSILPTGREMYDTLFADISCAQRSIHIECYLFEADEIFDTLERLLIDKVQQGVSVRIIYDYLGSYAIPRKRWSKMQKEGIEAYPFMQVAVPILSSSINYRNHRKLTIIDDSIGYIGGMNFAKRYRDGDSLGSWRDTHFRFEGSVVAGLQSIFLMDWYTVSRKVINIDRQNQLISTKQDNQAGIQLISGGPISTYPNIEQAMIGVITRAKKHIRVQTPYLLPTEALRAALISAALSGVEVEIMIPQHGDSRLTTYASNSYLEELLSAGIHIYRYVQGFLHSKLLLADSMRSVIGSANMDFRSLELNFEIVGVVYDPSMTEALEQLFERDKAHCTRLDTNEWRGRSRAQRLAEGLMRLFSPLL